ncbi:hypothetical protein [Nocardioides dongxiaopingii]|uniref:hypothetical protein n=1 Tax=Nocardioides dongxiaopingii TaxID=2576036 RepID=UPI0010C765EB|nr:hypothetical protein [Nocardioides dongxiaopingii]
MAVRRESVELSLTGDFTPRVIQAAGAVSLLHREINQLNGQNIRIDTRINQQMSGINRSVDQTSGSINQLTGRLGLFADAALILGPGLIPIAATGGVAIMGLVNAAGALVTVGAAAAAAFQGVGDAVGAVDAYQLDPTVANLEKAQQAMENLGPQAREFVMAFQDFQPVLAGIRDSAAAGLFPGLTESLDDFERLAPLVEQIFEKAGQAGGDVVANVADSLDSERWRPFMRFIGNEAPTAMHSLSRVLGDLAHGMSEMWMSFDPGNDAFLGWLEDVADGFDKWASSTEGREDIEGFLAYARQNGPEVAELFTSLVGALSSIVQAAAPLGGPVLQGLTAVADVIKAIADSDMATPLLAGIAALRLYSRLAPAVAAQQARIARMAAPPGLVTSPASSLGRQQAAAAAAANRQRMAMIGKGAGLAAGAGFLMSGAADDMDMTNTAMLTLIGTMAGPWGAAAGAATGMALDFAGASDAMEDAISKANAAIDSGDFTAMTSGIAAARAEIDKLRADSESTDGIMGFFQKAAPLSGVGLFGSAMDWVKGNEADKGEGEYAKLEARLLSAKEAAAGLGEAFGMTIGPLDGSARSTRELEAALAAAQPVMDKLGITTEELNAAQARKDGTGPGGALGWGLDRAAANGTIETYDQMIARLREGQLYAESVSGQMDNLGAAFASLSNEMLPASERATMLSTALDALIDPAMSAEAATDAWHSSLQNLRKELVDGAGFEGFRKGAIENRALTREYVDGVKQRLVAMVEAGAGEKQMMAAVRQSRAEFIKSGEAAGISGKEIRRRADAMGLTPDLVRTVFEAVGLVESTIKAERVRAIYNSLPENVQTKIAVDGVPKSRAEARQLANDLDLAGADRRAVIELGDLASSPARATGRTLDGVVKPRTARINVEEHGAAAVQIAINNIRGKTVTITTVHNNVAGTNRSYHSGDQAGADGGTWNGRRFAAAGGGTVPGKRNPYGDKIYAYLAPGEEVISNRYGQADRNRALLKQINANRMADGGTAGRRSSNGMSWDAFGVTLDTLADSASAASGGLKGLRERLKESQRALQAEQSQRSNAMSLKSQVAGSLAGDLFGNGLAGFDVGVAANGNDAKAMLAALAKAKKKGLDGPLLNLLAASGDLNTVQQFAALSRAEIDKRERQYGSSVTAQNNLGDYAVQVKYGESIDQMTAEIRDLSRINKKLEKRIDEMGSKVERGAERGSRKGNDDRNRNVLARSRTGR